MTGHLSIILSPPGCDADTDKPESLIIAKPAHQVASGAEANHNIATVAETHRCADLREWGAP